MVLREFGDPDVFESAAAAVERGEISINEELRRQFAAVTASLDDVVAWLLPRVRVRTGFHELVERFRPLVITSGFHEWSTRSWHARACVGWCTSATDSPIAALHGPRTACSRVTGWPATSRRG